MLEEEKIVKFSRIKKNLITNITIMMKIEIAKLETLCAFIISIILISNIFLFENKSDFMNVYFILIYFFTFNTYRMTTDNFYIEPQSTVYKLRISAYTAMLVSYICSALDYYTI